MKYFYKAIMPAGTHRKWFKLIFLIAAFLSLKTAAQIKSINDATQIIKTGEALKNIFKKKKNMPQSASTKDANVTTDNTVNDSLSTNSKKNISIKGGDIAPNAIYIDADVLKPFSGGAALIWKGSRSALINSKGAFVIPYNKYDFLLYASQGIITDENNYLKFSGFYEIGDNAGHMQIVTYNGRFVGSGMNFLKITNDGKFALFETNKKWILVDTTGKQYSLNNYGQGNLPINFFEGMSPISLDSSSPWNYITPSNRFITNQQFDRAEPFSEGMACVGKKDEFGEIKYGFIDNTGKLVIPFIFSNQPHNFHSGLAQVIPQDKNQFQFAYINKKGEFVIKFTHDMVGRFGDFNNGYAFNGNYSAMDTTGKIISLKEFFGRYNITPAIPNGMIGISVANEPYKDGKFKFVREAIGNLNAKNEDLNTTGFFDWKTKKVIYPAFYFTGSGALIFDPVSHLAYAEKYIGRDNGGNRRILKGYINEDGIFVIVKKEKSEW